MIYSARAILESKFTTTTVNAQITALNTALSTSATATASAVNGNLDAPKDASSFPALIRYVGVLEAAVGELAQFGKRDYRVPAKVQYISRNTTLASALVDVEVAGEALVTVLETVPGTQHSSTGRYCVDAVNPEFALIQFESAGEPLRYGVELSFIMLMRTEGV